MRHPFDQEAHSVDLAFHGTSIKNKSGIASKGLLVGGKQGILYNRKSFF
jgi:hypothetical protein